MKAKKQLDSVTTYTLKQIVTAIVNGNLEGKLFLLQKLDFELLDGEIRIKLRLNIYSEKDMILEILEIQELIYKDITCLTGYKVKEVNISIDKIKKLKSTQKDA